MFQVSLKRDWSVPDHMALGEALAPLRDEGVLIVASGHTTHYSRVQPPSLADTFTAWIHDAVANPAYSAADRRLKFSEAVELESFTPNHPTMDHYLPLPVASAAAGYAPGKLLWCGKLIGNLVASHFLFE